MSARADAPQVLLDRVEQAAAMVASARESLAAAIIDASKHGHPLRPIAAAAGLSVENVRRIARNGAKS